MLRSTRYGEIRRFELARTLFGGGRYWTACYQVGSLLIDSGCAHTAAEFLSALDRPPERLVNTHSHEDHIGANGLLQRRYPHLEIFAQPLAVKVLADPRREQPLQPYRRLFWGWPEPSLARPIADGTFLEVGRYRFQVIYMPGHSPDHLCLYEPEQGWFFSGDLFVGGRDRALRAGSDIWGIIASLKRLLELPIRILFPGSARVRENPQADLRAKVDYLEEIGGRILDLRRRGWSERAIARHVLGGTMWSEWLTLGHFSRLWLVRSYLGMGEQ